MIRSVLDSYWNSDLALADASQLETPPPTPLKSPRLPEFSKGSRGSGLGRVPQPGASRLQREAFSASYICFLDRAARHSESIVAGTGKLPRYLDFCTCESHRKSEQQHLRPGNAMAFRGRRFADGSSRAIKQKRLQRWMSRPSLQSVSTSAPVAQDMGCLCVLTISPAGEALYCHETSGPTTFFYTTSLKGYSYSTLVTSKKPAQTLDSLDGCNAGPQKGVARDGFLECNDTGLASHSGRGWRLFTQLPDEVGCCSWLRSGGWEQLDLEVGGGYGKQAKGISSHEPDGLMSIPPLGRFNSEDGADEKFESLDKQRLRDCEEHQGTTHGSMVASVVFRAMQSLVQKCFRVLTQIMKQFQIHTLLCPKLGVCSKCGPHVDCADFGSAGADDYVFDPGGLSAGTGAP